jgi:hypothetical protein
MLMKKGRMEMKHVPVKRTRVRASKKRSVAIEVARQRVRAVNTIRRALLEEQPLTQNTPLTIYLSMKGLAERLVCYLLINT